MLANAGDVYFEQVLRIIFFILPCLLPLYMFMLFRSFILPSMIIFLSSMQVFGVLHS